MSTKIYDGFRFRPRSLARIHRYLMDLRPAIHAAQVEAMSQWMATEATRIVDRRSLGILEGDDSSPFSSALTELWRRQKDIKTTGYRDTAVDWSFSLAVLPFRSRTYGIVYTEAAVLRDILRSQDWFEEYGWWDNSDGPDDVSSSAWNARGRTWNALLSQDLASRPSECGFGVDIETPTVMPKVPEIVSRIPAHEDRVRHHALDRVLTRFMERRREQFSGTDEEWRGRMMGVAMEGMRYSRSPDAVPELEEVSAEIAPLLPLQIDEALLVG